MDFSFLSDLIPGLVKGGFVAFDEIQERLAKKYPPVLPPLVPSRPSKRANWILEPIAKHSSGAIAYMLVNTSSAVVHNVEIFPEESDWKVTFIGDTEWPGEVSTMEPLVFYAMVKPEMNFGKPTARLAWQDFDGDPWGQGFELEITGSTLMDTLYTGG